MSCNDHHCSLQGVKVTDVKELKEKLVSEVCLRCVHPTSAHIYDFVHGQLNVLALPRIAKQGEKKNVVDLMFLYGMFYML